MPKLLPQQAVFDALMEQGILPAKARQLVQQHDPDQILAQIEYAKTHLFTAPNVRQKIANPAGFIIYNIENGLPVPVSLSSRRKRSELDALKAEQDRERERERTLQIKYSEWKEKSRKCGDGGPL